MIKVKVISKPLKGNAMGVDENIAKMFPKVSPMGFVRPSHWFRPEREGKVPQMMPSKATLSSHS
jgi:hypothetical protein